MDILKQILYETAYIFNESAIYILFGFFIAGIINFLLSPEQIFKYLGQDNLKSVFLASLFGIPLPLCSCSVLPTALSLRKQGASKGATLSFLISTPETGIDSISLTYALMDPIMTLARPFAALITAMTAGISANYLESRRPPSPPPEVPGEEVTSPTLAPTEHHPHFIASRGFFDKVFRYAYGDLLNDIALWLVISIFIAGVITTLVPSYFFALYLGDGLLSLLVMLGISVPLYMCAASSTPIAAALILKGLNPGAALVFLLAGPATNAGTVVMVAKFLGRNMMLIYVGTIVLISLILGTILNWIYFGFYIDPMATMGTASELIPPSVKLTGSVILLLLILNQLRGLTPERIRESIQERLHDLLGYPVSFDGRFLFVLWDSGRWIKKYFPVLLLIVYLCSGFYTVQPGEEGIVKRFGRVIAQHIPPGLHYRLPYPFESVETPKVTEVKRLEIGFRTRAFVRMEQTPLGPQPVGVTLFGEPLSMGRDPKEQIPFGLPPLPGSLKETGMDGEPLHTVVIKEKYEEAEMITGDENIINLKFTVQYTINNPFQYLFRVNRPEVLVQNLAESVMRQIVGYTEIDTLYSHGRSHVEETAKTLLQADLDRYHAGISIRNVSIIYDHAPDEVHPAFRDVASAEEDKNTRISQAHGYQSATLAQARGKAEQLLKQALGYKEEKVNQATGEAAAFLEKVAAYEGVEAITEWR